MANTTYQVTLSVKGQHSVSVASDDPVAVKTGLVWAKTVYDQLVARSNRQVEADQKEEEAPLCAVHNRPLVRQQGKFGPFWSCHERNEDGSFCSYRPEDR